MMEREEEIEKTALEKRKQEDEDEEAIMKKRMEKVKKNTSYHESTHDSNFKSINH